jgi:hypothetical protein
MRMCCELACLDDATPPDRSCGCALMTSARSRARAFAEPDRFIGADLKSVSAIQSNDQCRVIWGEAIGRVPRRFPMLTWMFERFVSTDLTNMWRWLRTATPTSIRPKTRMILPTASTVQDWLGDSRSP